MGNKFKRPDTVLYHGRPYIIDGLEPETTWKNPDIPEYSLQSLKKDPIQKDYLFFGNVPERDLRVAP